MKRLTSTFAVTPRYFSLSLRAKLALAFTSVGTYGLLNVLSARSETVDAFLSRANSGMHFVAIVFGALVMVPYLAPTGWRVVRALLMCIASAVIYYAAVRFVADGPLGYSTITSFVLSGGGAALLTGLAIVVLGPQPFTWKIIPVLLVAGAAGGAVFEYRSQVDEIMLLAHAAWQLLACLALHFSFRKGPI